MKIIAMIIIALLAGFAGSYFTMPAIATWYATLNKPFFTPPSWLFAPVWTTLYILMGAASGIVWKKTSLTSKPMQWYWLQLALNVVWSLLFFGFQSPGLGLMGVALLWAAIFMTMNAFKQVDKNAYRLMIPYICWVTVASLLNFGVMVLN
jgi:tryptophan-rich sensory protein